MCGRYVCRSDKQKIAEAFAAGEAEDFAFELAPSWNAAPQSTQCVIRISAQTGRREMLAMRWGLVPFWAKDTKVGYSTINARAESLLAKPLYREAARQRRCLIPADAFYEWRAGKVKQPYAFALKDDRLFAFAGLWESWKDRASGAALKTFTIITTDANELVAPFEDRMPAILNRADYGRWLAPTEANAPPIDLPLDLLRPYPAEAMKAWEVSPSVGNTRNDGPELLEPYQNAVPGQRDLFLS